MFGALICLLAYCLVVFDVLWGWLLSLLCGAVCLTFGFV